MKTWALMVKGDKGWEFAGFTHDEERATGFLNIYRGSAFHALAILVEVPHG